MKRFLVCLSVILCASILFVSAGKGKALPKGEPLDSELDSLDSSLFHTASWVNGDPFNCGWGQDHVTFADGKMTLHLDDKPSHGKKYTGAEFRTNKTYPYGTFSTRMKAAKCDGIVSSFFTYTNKPVWDEIDFEVLGKDTTKVQVNYYVKGVGGHEKMIDLGFDASEDFHEYAFKWMPGQIEWYVDGKLVHTVKGKNLPENPQQIMMNLWNGKGVDDWLKKFKYSGELTASYDYVKYEPLSE